MRAVKYHTLQFSVMADITSTPTMSSAWTRAPKLAQRLVAHFSERIRDGSFKPGSKLPTEYEIMREHSVSRAVVREAISQLQAAGQVQARQGIGTFVLETVESSNFRIDPTTIVTMRDVIALLELRIGIETEAAALAADRHTPHDVKQMEATLARFQKNLEKGGETVKPDFEFHMGIAAATGNRYFTEVLSHLGLAILPRVRVDVRYLARDNTYGYLDRANREHRDIFDAIIRHDAPGARAAMQIHLGNVHERLLRLAATVEETSDSKAQ